MHLKTDFLKSSIFFVASTFLSLSAQKAFTYDTAARTIEETEKSFLQKNFLLLAAKYEISAADAAIIQAKLYPNPNLSIDQGAYNQQSKTWFDLSNNGQTAISLSQLILLGGKRNKQINIAKVNVEIAKYQFYDLIRTLGYELRTSFYGLYFLRQSISVYDKEIQSLKTLIDAYSIQYNKGNISFSELARLQALHFGLENERMDLVKDASEKQSNLIILTGDSTFQAIKPILDTSLINRIQASELQLAQLIDTALLNRYDLRVADANVKLSESKLALQKALKVPDLTIGASWDRQGSYIPNYNSISLAMDLPFFNRNQGNIKIAEFQMEESKNAQSQAELQVKNEIIKAYTQFLEMDKLYKTTSKMFNADYDKLLEGITLGYRNRTISLLEFIDYYETYKNSIKEFNRLQSNRLEALESLSTATATKLLK